MLFFPQKGATSTTPSSRNSLYLYLSLTFDKNLLAIDNKRALESPMKIVQLVNKKEDEEFSLQFQFPQFLHYGGGVSFFPSFFVDDVKVVVIFFPSSLFVFSGRRRRPGVPSSEKKRLLPLSSKSESRRQSVWVKMKEKKKKKKKNKMSFFRGKKKKKNSTTTFSLNGKNVCK